MTDAKSNVIKLSSCKREIEMEIPASEVEDELKRILAQYVNRAKIKGFRPGKAPQDIVKRTYYPEIKDSLINSIIPRALNEELNAHNLNPVSTPVINNLSFQEGQPLRFKAQLEIWPEFILPEYKNIKVEKKEAQVTAKDIKQTLEELQAKSAQYVPVEGREVVDGDYVVTEIQSSEVESKRLSPKEKVVILAGHSENEKILNQNLIGLKPNEERKFTVKYDSNHQNKKFAGNEIEHKMKVVSIKEKKLPEINDDFAKDLGEFGNLKELKSKLKSELKISKENASRRDLEEEILKRISDRVVIEIPETVQERESLAIMQRILSSQPQQAFRKEDIEKIKGETRKRAELNIKSHLVLKRIAEKEDINVSEGEVSEELKNIAKANKIPLAKVTDSINQEGRKEELKENLLFKKTVDFLVKHAIIE